MSLLIDSAGQETSVHGKNVTGDEAGAFRGQENGGAHQFMQLPEPLHGCAQEKFPAALGAIQQLSVEFSAKHPRSNGIHAYTMAGPFNG